MSDAHIERELEEAAEAGAGLPLLPVRLLQVFVSPGALFERLKERPVYFTALLLGAGLVALNVFLTPPDLMLSAAREQIIESGGQIPDGFEDRVGLFRTFGIGAGVLTYFIFAFLGGGIVLTIFNFLFGEEATFKQYMSVLSHAFLITALSSVALLPLRIATGDPQMLLSVGTLMPFFGDGYLQNFLNLLDLFGLWTWAVVGAGVVAITRKQTWGGATAKLLVIPLGFSAILAFFV